MQFHVLWAWILNYHGTTSFQGLHTHNELILDESQQNLYGKEKIYKLFPEYYLIRINSFDVSYSNFLVSDQIDRVKTNKIIKKLL